MGAEDFLVAVKIGEKGLNKYLNSLARYFYRFELPLPRLLSRLLYEVLVLFRVVIPFVLERSFYVPIFRSRCESCGKGLSIRNKIPWVEGNLSINIGDNVELDKVAFIGITSECKPLLTIGDRTYIGYGTVISVLKNVSIGNDCLIARNCFIADNRGHWINPVKRRNRVRLDQSGGKAVTIGNNVWIGTGAVILRGVNIGENSIVSANSVVNRDVPPNSIVLGLPARKVLGDIDQVNA